MSQITALFERPPVSMWDVFDILIMSFLIYEGLKLIRGTRAMQMVIGSVLVLALFYVSELLPLRTVGWLIQTVVTYAPFAAIVLFQSDIRRALSQLGSTPVFRYFARDERAAETIEEIITAAGMLAKAKVGAIIAIEREIGLRNFVESGIPIDAAVSYDLLTTIFQPGTPLHDGAVIIQEDRVAAAACFLPLTVNPHLDRDLGTRHRAAIGLTEESDAIAVIISEERGEISLSQHGRIVRGLSPDDLRVQLQRLILRRRPRRHPERGGRMDLDL
jgi:diadenylate cyclase